MIEGFSQKFISEYIMEQIQERVVDVIRIISQVGLSEFIDVKITDVPTPLIQEQSVDLLKVIPQEHVYKRTVEQRGGMLVPQILRENRGKCSNDSKGAHFGASH